MKRPCVNFRNGYCPYTGGQCRDNMPGPCPLWRPLAKATAARIRWARARLGEGTIGRKKATDKTKKGFKR